MSSIMIQNDNQKNDVGISGDTVPTLAQQGSQASVDRYRHTDTGLAWWGMALSLDPDCHSSNSSAAAC